MDDQQIDRQSTTVIKIPLHFLGNGYEYDIESMGLNGKVLMWNEMRIVIDKILDDNGVIGENRCREFIFNYDLKLKYDSVVIINEVKIDGSRGLRGHYHISTIRDDSHNLVSTVLLGS